MDVRVLGCYGREMPGFRTACLLVNGNLMIDAGAATSALPLKDQARIDNVIITHSHIDHVRDLPFLIDNIFGKREEPVAVYALAETLKAIKENIFNFSVWPDFSKLPNPENPVMTFHEIKGNETIMIGGLEILPVRVNHAVPTVGVIVKGPGQAFAYSSDTGPTRDLWQAVNNTPELKTLIVDTTFPDRHADRAEKQGHLTPGLLAAELEKISNRELDVKPFHMAPQYLREITDELAAIDGRLAPIKQGEHIVLS